MKKSQKKTEDALNLLRQGQSMIATAKAIGIDPCTLYEWMKKDPDFEAQVDAIRDSRHIMVEETLYGRILSGKCSPAEIIFYLKNRAPKRWKDKQIHKVEDSSLSGVLRELFRKSGRPLEEDEDEES